MYIGTTVKCFQVFCGMISALRLYCFLQFCIGGHFRGGGSLLDRLPSMMSFSDSFGTLSKYRRLVYTLFITSLEYFMVSKHTFVHLIYKRRQQPNMILLTFFVLSLASVILGNRIYTQKMISKLKIQVNTIVKNKKLLIFTLVFDIQFLFF